MQKELLTPQKTKKQTSKPKTSKQQQENLPIKYQSDFGKGLYRI
jgi:hypothetical protein